MHSAIATDYIRKRMAELGHGDDYDLRLRHFILAPDQEVTHYFPGQLLVMLEPLELVSISSDTGFYDPMSKTANELQYEHTGMLTMHNRYHLDKWVHVRFLQAIPHHNR